jgi:hypothetical protein
MSDGDLQDFYHRYISAINARQFAAYKVRDGRFAEMWFLMDSATVAEQLRG